MPLRKGPTYPNVWTPWSNMRETKSNPSYNGSPVFVMTATTDNAFRLVDSDVFCQQVDFQVSASPTAYAALVGDRNNQLLVLATGTTYTVYNVNLKDYWFKNNVPSYNTTIHAHVVLA